MELSRNKLRFILQIREEAYSPDHYNASVCVHQPSGYTCIYTSQTCFTSTAYQRNISRSSVGLILTCASTWPIKTAYCCVCLRALTRRFPSDLLGQTMMSFLSPNDRNSGPLLVLLPQINDRRKLEKDQWGALVWNVFFNHILSPSQLSSLSWDATTLSCIMTSGITMCSA